ncbi:cytochrome P450 [Salinisphaera aquimarina]|uniref:Cytochrome P450 n=1 Tax=Salinisphaera aquimarina TaxID=2094031 RepID=A0ABV7EQ39_9GAMM
MKIVEDHVAVAPPAGVPVWDIDPYEPAVLADPTAYYRELRDKGPFVYLSRYAALACGRYDVTKEVFGDWERFVSSRGVGLLDFKLKSPWRAPSRLLEVDPPYHTQTRKVMGRALSPKVVMGLKDRFRAVADKLVAELVTGDSFDAVPELAETFPTTVFPEAVGMRETDRDRLLDYGSMVFNGLGPDNSLRRRNSESAADTVAWISQRCQRDALTRDGVGALIYAAVDAGEATEEEANMLVRSFLSAGVDTTVSGIGGTLWCLAHHPEAFERLKADPRLVRVAFEEVLRYTSPVHTFCRTAAADTTVADVPIQADTKILCTLAAANLDPEKWTDAARFDVARKPVGHLAFGTGIHACVGQNLARAEVEAILLALIERVDRIELTGEACWRPNNSMRSLETLPIRLVAS